MGSSVSSSSDHLAQFLDAFALRAGEASTLSFAAFMELALYHPELGYYATQRRRVGYGGETDFYTASTSGPIFGELVTAACVSLLNGHSPPDYKFIEIGAENGRGILAEVAHPFASAAIVSVGQEIHLQGKCVVFSNELFDAQPFHRFMFRAGQWRELGVKISNGELKETELMTSTARLPTHESTEGYILDAPEGSVALTQNISQQPWSGLFVACDYGKFWRELIEASPNGTARAYYRHQQSNDLYAQPGEQDLTCHICWDWLVTALNRARFGQVAVDSQESFFIHHAGDFIAKTMAAEAANFSQKKLSLMQLLHPSHLGQKFQVLHGFRAE